MQASTAPQIRTLLLTDLVDSTHLVERLGDGPAAELFRVHDRLVLELQQRWRGRLIDRSDGLLLIFERPIDGLGFALDYVRGLRDLGRELQLKLPLQARAGLHVGEVLSWENSADAVRLGAKQLEIEGLAKPLAGRLMALARAGQILLSATALFDDVGEARIGEVAGVTLVQQSLRAAEETLEQRLADRFDVRVDAEVFSVDPDAGKVDARGGHARAREEVWSADLGAK